MFSQFGRENRVITPIVSAAKKQCGAASKIRER